MTTLWFDCETFSECDLKSAGTHRYAEHPSTEITVAQWAIDDGEPHVIDCTEDAWQAGDGWGLTELLDDPSVTVVAHNSMFDRTLLRHCWGIDVPVERWQDTMIKAMAHGLPGGLDKIGQILGLPNDQAKDKRGRELIQLFCKPRPKNQILRRATRETHPKEWNEFLEYSRQDIVAMRAIDARLPDWNYRHGHAELALWHLDQRINDRGVAVDVELARSAITAVAFEQKRLKNEVQEHTDNLVGNVSQRDSLLAFICAEYGVDLPDMKADTVKRRLEDPTLPDGVKLLLAMRLEGTKTSTAKYRALINATSEDGRLRNTLQFAGAQRTARWAGRIFQPQNLPRPNLDLVADHFQVPFKKAEDLLEDYLEQGIDALKGGYADVVFDNVIGLTANAVRGCIVAPEGKKLTIADLSNIEGRGLAYLAGEKWKLKAFADFDAGTGEDLYKVAYGRSFNIDPKEATGQKRQIGKVMELGLGFGGGVAAFITFAVVYQMDLNNLADAVWATASAPALENAQGMWLWATEKKRTMGLTKEVYVACEVLKRAWRDAHPNTEALWKAADDSVKAAIANPGQSFPIGKHLKARVDGKWLRIRLPSGRYLCYINPSVDETGQITYFGVNQYTRVWGRIKTYGGKLCIAEGTLVLTAKGWSKIEDVTTIDKVWDGVEWVTTDGNVCNGTREVMEAHGAWMTPDHLVLTTEGWKDASQSKGHKRAACRLPDGVAVPRERRAQVAVGGRLRLRNREAHGPERVQEAGQTRGGSVAQVYDLINCGPRHRFVIWADGAPLIVHNCENATQAFARDILAYNMPAIEAAGYEIVLSVHDELLTETPDTPEFTADELGRMMATAPSWAAGLPLAAAGFETYRYRKG